MTESATGREEGESPITPLPLFTEISTHEAVQIVLRSIQNDVFKELRYDWRRWGTSLLQLGYISDDGTITDKGKEWLNNAF